MVTRRPPSRISEGFRSTMAQGQWAENKAIETINKDEALRAIRYGQSRVTFKDRNEFLVYWERMHKQVLTYGKRPDVLVFEKSDSLDYPDDISESNEKKVMDIVKQSLAGLECRSSTWLLDKYRKIQGKDLNFTVKEEDLDVLIRWSQTYDNKKVYYVQFFFDSAFALSFDQIRQLLQFGRKNRDYRLKVDRKTEKNTYFIPVSKGVGFADCTEMPTLDCETLIDEIGKVMAIRTPQGGKYALSPEFVEDLLHGSDVSQRSLKNFSQQ